MRWCTAPRKWLRMQGMRVGCTVAVQSAGAPLRQAGAEQNHFTYKWHENCPDVVSFVNEAIGV